MEHIKTSKKLKVRDKILIKRKDGCGKDWYGEVISANDNGFRIKDYAPTFDYGEDIKGGYIAGFDIGENGFLLDDWKLYRLNDKEYQEVKELIVLYNI